MKTILFTSVIVLAGCANRQPAPSAAPAPQQAATADESGPRAPLVVSWNERQLTPRSAQVEARVQYNGPFDQTLHLTVQVPAGVTVTRGQLELDLPAQTTATTVVSEYELSFDQVPQGDLVLVADARSQVSGVHATSAYRFGRSAPKGPTPQATGPELNFHGNNFGPSVPLQPAPK